MERRNEGCPYKEHSDGSWCGCWGGPKLRQVSYDDLFHSVLTDAFELKSDEDANYLFNRARQYKPGDAPED